MRSLISGLTAIGLALGFASVANAAEKTEISITRQPGIIYLASHVMETQKLIEKHAAADGLKGVKVDWRMFSGGGAQTDALLSGNVDVVDTGTGNLLLLWDRTKGHIKGICTNSAQPLIMVSRDPHLKSLKDVKPDDKIAVPTVGVSTQAILLQMAAAKMYGWKGVHHFDANTVQLGHPDAMAAIANDNSEVKTEFSAPPYQYLELKMKGAHAVTSSRDILGGDLSEGTFFTTTTFADANPTVIKAIREATTEAIAYIKKDPEGALADYKKISGDKTSIDELMWMLKQPHMMEYRMDPQGTMQFARHLYKIGTLKTMPKSWKDYFLPEAADLNGN